MKTGALSDAVRPDLVNDAYLARLAKRILIRSQIFFGQCLDVGVRSLFGDFDHLTLHVQMAIWIVRIDDGGGYFLLRRMFLSFTRPLVELTRI
jgi:hypothetical protein